MFDKKLKLLYKIKTNLVYIDRIRANLYFFVFQLLSLWVLYRLLTLGKSSRAARIIGTALVILSLILVSVIWWLLLKADKERKSATYDDFNKNINVDLPNEVIEFVYGYLQKNFTQDEYGVLLDDSPKTYNVTSQQVIVALADQYPKYSRLKDINVSNQVDINTVRGLLEFIERKSQ